MSLEDRRMHINFSCFSRLNGRMPRMRMATRQRLRDLFNSLFVVFMRPLRALHWLAQSLAEPAEESPLEMLAFLLQNGAPKNWQNSLGETALMSAVRLAALEPQRTLVLIEGFLVKGRVDAGRADLVGETPLMEVGR